MAKGFKTGGRDFVKGVVTNPKGRPKQPLGLKEARAVNAEAFENTVYQYINKPLDFLKKSMTDPNTPTRDLIIIKIIAMAIENGDVHKLGFLLERTIGKVPDHLKLDANIKSINLHAAIMADLKQFREGDDGESS